MYTTKKVARDYLTDCSLTDFWTVVREAKISEADMEILDARFVKGHSIVRIAMDLGYSEDKVKQTISKSYDKVYNLIMR